MQYRYAAYATARGVLTGRLEAPTERVARQQLAEEGLTLIRIRSAWRIPPVEDLFPSLFRTSSGDLIRFARAAAALLASGAGLLKSIELVERETRNRVMRRTLASVRASVEGGDSLSEALAKHPRVFSSLFVSVVEVGEHTGQLATALEQMAVMLEREQQARQRAIRTVAYPMAIMGMAFITLGVLITVALPPLMRVFEQMGTQTPVMTRIAVGMVSGLKVSLVPLAIGAVAAGAAFWLARRHPRGRLALDSAVLRAPLAGPLVLTGELARFSRVIALLLDAGVPLVTALRQGTAGCHNAAIRAAFVDAESELISGHSLASALTRHDAVPPMFVELVVIGEESNSMAKTLRDAASTYEKEFEQRVNHLVGMLEPVSTLAVGGIVAFIAFSMFLPIYSGLDAFQ
jgi:type II secretory pathway component PulF